MGSFVMLVAVVVLASLGINSCHQNSLQEQANAIQSEKNKTYILKNILTTPVSGEIKTTDAVKTWVKENIDSKNQDVFLHYAQDLRSQTLKVDDSEEFSGFEEKLSVYPFCIDGEKDLQKFEEFQSIVYESEEQKKILSLARTKYKLDVAKVEIPDTEVIKEFCGFTGGQ